MNLQLNKRDIKFRAWDKEHNSWFEPDEFRIDGNGDVRFSDHDRPQNWGVWGEQYELMQYTGLHDRDGREIYEGDIVQRVDRIGDKPAKVFWSTRKLQWSLHDGEKVQKLATDNFQRVYEVIGNIHENGDLLI